MAAAAAVTLLVDEGLLQVEAAIAALIKKLVSSIWNYSFIVVRCSNALLLRYCAYICVMKRKLKIFKVFEKSQKDQT